MTLLMAPAAPVGYLYGSIVDLAKKADWAGNATQSAVLGFRTSFVVCAALILCGIVLAVTKLPRHPREANSPA